MQHIKNINIYIIINMIIIIITNTLKIGKGFIFMFLMCNTLPYLHVHIPHAWTTKIYNHLHQQCSMRIKNVLTANNSYIFFQVSSILESSTGMRRYFLLSLYFLFIFDSCNPVNCFTLAIYVSCGLRLSLPKDVITCSASFIILLFLFICSRYTNLCLFLLFYCYYTHHLKGLKLFAVLF